MRATLAHGGVNPLSDERAIAASTCRLDEAGLPGKRGIGGGTVTLAPGKGGLGTLAAAFLSRRLGLDLFLSRPAA